MPRIAFNALYPVLALVVALPACGSDAPQFQSNDIQNDTMAVHMGSVVRVATELPLLVIGNHTFHKIRLCMQEVTTYLRPDDTACIYVFRHMLRKQLIIGVRSENGPSWTMSFGRMLITVLTYLIVWALLAGIPCMMAGRIIGIPFGTNGVATGITLGLLFGIGLAWLSGLRLFLTWREMQHD